MVSTLEIYSFSHILIGLIKNKKNSQTYLGIFSLGADKNYISSKQDSATVNQIKKLGMRMNVFLLSSLTFASLENYIHLSYLLHITLRWWLNTEFSVLLVFFSSGWMLPKVTKGFGEAGAACAYNMVGPTLNPYLSC